MQSTLVVSSLHPPLLANVNTVPHLSSDAVRCCSPIRLRSRQLPLTNHTLTLPEMWSNYKVTCTDLAFQVVAVLPSPLRSILSLSPSRNTAHRALSVPTEPISTTSNIIQEMSSRGGKLAPEVNR